MAKLKVTKALHEVLVGAENIAIEKRNKYLEPEHLLHSLIGVEKFVDILESFEIDVDELEENLEEYFDEAEKVSDSFDLNSNTLKRTVFYEQVLNRAGELTVGNNFDTVRLQYIILALFELEDCYFNVFLSEYVDDLFTLSTAFAHTNFGDESEPKKMGPILGGMSINGGPMIPMGDIDEGFLEFLKMMGVPLDIGNPAPNMVPETSKNKKNSTTKPELKFLSKYGVCLNDKEFKPVIGRDKEILLTCRTLARKDKSNPIHVGEPGVGKTAIVHGLVQAIKEGNVPEQIKDCVVYEISLGSLVAGTKYRGEFEERLKGLINDALSDSKIILYIDEIHQLVGSGAAGTGSMDGAQILKPYLNDGSIKCIGATTYAEYKKYIESDSALMRRFKKIDIAEPSVEETISILNGLKETYEKHHNVIYNDDAIETAVNLSHKYLTERFLPDKAIDLLDEAGAYLAQNGKGKNKKVTKTLVQQILAETCNIPSSTVGSDEAKVLMSLDKNLKKVVFGQDDAIEALVESMFNARAGLTNENKPMGAYLFVGPTGTGKTEVAKQLAKKMGLHFIRYNMSEYMEKHTASKLIGAPAGYVGYDEGGLLTEDIRKHPYCVLLLDEFEKAHEDIYNLFLQVMDDATLTDNQGRTADFRNVIIIMTSNAGASNLGQKTLGFNSVSKDESVMTEAVNKSFTPEFRNRLSDIIIFNGMDDKMAKLIATKEINILKSMLKDKGITLKIAKNVIPAITEKVTKPEFGGREVIRIVEKEIKPLFSRPIVSKKIKEGSVVELSFNGDKFEISY